MNLFSWRKNLSISELDPTFKVRYLGNVQTSVMKGEGCADRSANIIWNNYMRSEHPGIDMKVVLTGSGMKAYTKEQGLTEYRAHRISYCIAHPEFPRLFLWIYRHEGRKLKLELRCHAVLCKNEAKAKAMTLQLHEKLSFALKEFQRDKLRKQNSRLTLQRLQMTSNIAHALPLRTQLLSTAKNFKPPISKSNTAPKLLSITEDEEGDEYVEEEEEEEYEEAVDRDDIIFMSALKRGSAGARLEGNNNSMPTTPLSAGPSNPELIHNGLEHHDILEALDLEAVDSFDEEYFTSDPIIDLQVGNDLDALRRDQTVQYCMHEDDDSDEESAESGFHDQDQDVTESDKERATRKESVVLERRDETVNHLPSYSSHNLNISTVNEKTCL